MNQEYKSLLEKELKLYPYRKTGVRRVNGIDIDMPMIYEDVSSIMFFLYLYRELQFFYLLFLKNIFL